MNGKIASYYFTADKTVECRKCKSQIGRLTAIEVMVEKVEHGLGLGYDFRYAQHCCGLPRFDVVTAYPFEHIFQVGKGDKEITSELVTAAEDRAYATT